MVKYKKNVIYELPVCYLKILNLTNLKSSTYVTNVISLYSRFAGYTIGTGEVRYLHLCHLQYLLGGDDVGYIVVSCRIV